MLARTLPPNGTRLRLGCGLRAAAGMGDRALRSLQSARAQLLAKASPQGETQGHIPPRPGVLRPGGHLQILLWDTERKAG